MDTTIMTTKEVIRATDLLFNDKPTIKSRCGIEYHLSREIYRMTNNCNDRTLNCKYTANYKRGALVRIIISLDQGEPPNPLFVEGGVWVCRLDAKFAEFAFVNLKDLRLV